MGKLMERMVTNRPFYVLEHHKILAFQQAGFRPRNCTKDQIICLTQHINDGFQHRPMHHTLLTLLDLSKAYNTVWRDGLIHKMVNMWIDPIVIRWVQSWLSNRRNYITINNTASKMTNFKQGVFQGKVISPLPFLIYINDLLNVGDKDVNLSLFVDDKAM